MTSWHRHSPFNSTFKSEYTEIWEYQARSGTNATFEVQIKVGKELDVLSLKGTDLSETREYSEMLAQSAATLYTETSAVHQIEDCPICHSSLHEVPVELKVFGVPYVRCSSCGHVCVSQRPNSEVLDVVFAESEAHSSIYIDRGTLEVRMNQVVFPKLSWCLEVFNRSANKAPKTVLDVGAGGGHFLAGAQQFGLGIEGFELSTASRAFAQEAFNITLRNEDFLGANCTPADLITFWGLLEYVEQPRDFLSKARKVIAPGGMLIVEVPRVDSLSTQVQAMDGAIVARHMDPTTHVNGFTDESLCTALIEEGFAPVAAWYFGMDAYEMFTQIALSQNNPELFSVMVEFIPVLQKIADLGRQCDDVIIAAVPLEAI